MSGQSARAPSCIADLEGRRPLDPTSRDLSRREALGLRGPVHSQRPRGRSGAHQADLSLGAIRKMTLRFAPTIQLSLGTVFFLRLASNHHRGVRTLVQSPISPGPTTQHGEAVPNVMGAFVSFFAAEAPYQRPACPAAPPVVRPNLDRSTAWGRFLTTQRSWRAIRSQLCTQPRFAQRR